jgi:23S rRNA (adenine2503-C2)-methyltransferase
MTQDMKDMTREQLGRLVVGLGQKQYLADYIFRFVHVQGVKEIAAISPLSKACRSELVKRGCYISALSIERKLVDPDGTVKYVFSLRDGNRIESVLLKDGRRKTLCVSTQVGCAMGCAFCATANVKLRRNLTAAEIVDQVYAVESDGAEVSNVVYMGMGEPLQNYDAVVRSIEILNHSQGRNIGIRHLTISTCGIAPGIRKLANETLHPRLAISLNAPTDQLRRKLMPITAKYPIAEVLDAVRYYQAQTKQRVSFEYVMIKGFNDKVLHAQMVAKLLKGLMAHVNLIEFNPHPGCEFAGSDSRAIERFAKVLEDAGIETTVRRRMGANICAACGQLGAACIQK